MRKQFRDHPTLFEDRLQLEDEYVEQNTGGIPIVPVEFALHQN